MIRRFAHLPYNLPQYLVVAPPPPPTAPKNLLNILHAFLRGAAGMILRHKLCLKLPYTETKRRKKERKNE